MKPEEVSEEVLEEVLEVVGDYEGLEQFLRELPMTWYPALITEMVKAAYEKDVFQTGGASRLIKRIEEESP